MDGTTEQYRPERIQAELGAALRRALRERDGPAVAALRSAMSAIANAEALPDPGGERGSQAPDASLPGSDHVAGAMVGLRAAEADRNVLSPEQVVEILGAELDLWESSAAAYQSLGRPAAAERLRAEAAALQQVLDEMGARDRTQEDAGGPGMAGGRGDAG